MGWNDAHYVFPPEGKPVLAFWEEGTRFEVLSCHVLSWKGPDVELRSSDGTLWPPPTLWSFIAVPVVLHDLTDPQMSSR